MKTIIKFSFVMLMAVVVAFSGVGCASMDQSYGQNPSAWNQGLLGTAIGTGVGLMAANNVKGLRNNRAEAALVGGALGGLMGYNQGSANDRNNARFAAQQAEMQQLRAEANTFVINVTNSNGSFTPVAIRRVGNQFMGPRGEYYSSMPTADQLKSYGF